MGNAGLPASPNLVVGVAFVAGGLTFGLAAPVVLEFERFKGTAGSLELSVTHSLSGTVGSAEAACRSAGLMHRAGANNAAMTAIGVRVMRIIKPLIKVRHFASLQPVALSGSSSFLIATLLTQQKAPEKPVGFTGARALQQ